MLWIKSFHIIAVVTWFAGLFYLPRLFVYHSGDGAPQAAETFKTMERRLYRGIMQPSMIAVVGLGLWLWLGYWPEAGWWLHAKLMLVAALLAYHFYLGHLVGVFAADANRRPPRFYRILNEAPTPVLVAVILLVEFKPGG